LKLPENLINYLVEEVNQEL